MKILTHEGLQYFYNQIAAKFSTKEQTAEAIEEAVGNAGVGTVTSVNGKTGVVQLSASDVGAATEIYVDNKVASMVDSAPETLNTLNELAAALGDDPNFATTVATEIGGKVSKSGDTMTGWLTAPRFLIKSGDGYPALVYLNANGTQISAIHTGEDTHRTYIAQTAIDTSYQESYMLPAISTGLTASKNYSILTSKSPVTIAQGGTGAVNEVTAANNLKVQSLGHGTDVPANANLNNYTTVGNYRCSTTSAAETIANCPVANAFTLQVYAATGTSTSAPTTASWAYFIQKFTTIGGAQYYRTMTFANSTTATFGNWVKIYDSVNNKPTAADVGALPTRPASIEMLPDAYSNHGGFIDFHYNGSTLDHTSRIIEDSENYLNINAFEGGKVKLGRVTAGTWQGSAIGLNYGGTGATTRAGAINNLFKIGTSPVTSTRNDTVTNWTKLGNGVSFYGTSGQLVDQPAQYGTLLNLNAANSEVAQLWFSAPNGAVYHRGANDGGWSGTWIKFYDTSNKPTPAEIGAASSSHTHASLVKSTSSYSGSMSAEMVDQSGLLGWVVSGKYSNSDTTTVALSLRVNKDNGSIQARVDSKAGTKYPTFYTTLNKPSAAEIGAAPTSHTHHNLIAGNGNAGELFWHDDFLLSSATRTVPSLHFGTELLYRHDSSTSQYYSIYDTGNKPTAADVGAIPISGVIAANTDLNTITTPGFYHCAANATVATLANTPTGNAFYMEVGKHAGVYQRIVEYTTAGTAKIYIRNYYAGTWSAWGREYTTWDKPTAADVGALALTGGTVSGAVTINNTLTATKVIGAVYA